MDEFAQFARMPAPRAAPSDLTAALIETLNLYDGLVKTVRIERAFAADLPLGPDRRELDQARVINLADNAIEATGGATALGGEIVADRTRYHGRCHPGCHHRQRAGTSRATATSCSRLRFDQASRQRGSASLAIVRRIVAEHGGSIEVTDNEPKRHAATIELPGSRAPVERTILLVDDEAMRANQAD